MLTGEAIQAVFEGLNVHTDDSGISDEYVLFTLLTVRAELLKQEADKNKLWDGFSSTLISGITLKKSSSSESKDFTAKDIVFKSVDPLPELIDTMFGKVITNVFFDTGEKIYVTNATFASTLKKRTIPTLPLVKCMIRDNRLHVTNFKEDTEELLVNLEAIVLNPIEVQLKNNQVGYIPSFTFDTPGYIVRRVIEMTVATIRQKYALPEDTKNNAQNDINLKQQQNVQN